MMVPDLSVRLRGSFRSSGIGGLIKQIAHRTDDRLPIRFKTPSTGIHTLRFVYICHSITDAASKLSAKNVTSAAATRGPLAGPWGGQTATSGDVGSAICADKGPLGKSSGAWAVDRRLVKRRHASRRRGISSAEGSPWLHPVDKVGCR